MSWPIYVIMTVVIFIHNNEPFLKYIIYVKNLGAIHDLVCSILVMQNILIQFVPYFPIRLLQSPKDASLVTTLS